MPPPGFIDATASHEGLGLIDPLIPANPFSDPASNKLPAIVIFSIVYGVATQRLRDKQSFLSFLEVSREASVTIWRWLVLLAPLGVLSLFAATVGSLELTDAANLSLYLITMVCGTLILALWILPSVISALCPLSHREIFRDL